MDLVSVLMSAYNSEIYIEDSVRSILNQRNVNLELLIVNDGSTDSTYEIIKKLTAEDNRVRIINQDNAGLPLALNKAIIESKGNFLARMDADDIAFPERLWQQLKYLNEHPEIDIVASYVEAFGDGRNRIWKFPTKKEDCDVALLFFNPLPHPAVMFRRSVIEKTGFYNTDFEYDQDYELWARASSNHAIANIGLPLLKYRIHKNQMGSLYSKNFRIDSQKKTQRYLLNQVGIEASETDLFLHSLLSNSYRYEFDINVSVETLKEVAAWIQRLHEINNISNRYNDQFLKKRIRIHYFSLCLYSANKGMKVYKQYAKVMKTLNQSVINLLLLVSCLLKLGRKQHLVIFQKINFIKTIIGKSE